MGHIKLFATKGALSLIRMRPIALGQVMWTFSLARHLTPSSIQKPRPPSQVQKREANFICLCYTLQTFPTECQAFKKKTFFSSFHPSNYSAQRWDTHRPVIWNDKVPPELAVRLDKHHLQVSLQLQEVYAIPMVLR